MSTSEAPSAWQRAEAAALARNSFATVPASDREVHEVARAAVEALDLIDALTAHVRALQLALATALAGQADTSALRALPDYSDLKREAGPGARYVRARLDAVDRGEWGEEGLAAALERERLKVEEAKRQDAMARLGGDQRQQRLNQAFARHARQMGAKRVVDGRALWPTYGRGDDPEGKKREAEAWRRARAEMDGTNENGGGV